MAEDVLREKFKHLSYFMKCQGCGKQVHNSVPMGDDRCPMCGAKCVKE